MDLAPPTETEEPALPAPADAARIAELRRKARTYRRISRVGSWLSFLGFSGASGLMIANLHQSLPVFFTTFAGVGLGIIGICIELRARNLRQKAIEELIPGNSINLICPLIEEIDLKMPTDAAQPALSLLLPRLQATDAPLLMSRHHRILNGVLRHKPWFKINDHSNLLLAILKAYEQVGNKEDLPAVARLAAGEGYAKKDKRIQEAAKECLPYLQARSEQQESRQTLLRASGATAESGESLLRPAQTTNPTEPRQLLRAANSETLE